MKKIGVLGSGAVGKVLADGFLKHGYDVMLGSREPAKLAAWQAAAGSRGQRAPSPTRHGSATSWCWPSRARRPRRWCG